jgi:hypothetical protein
MGYFWDDWYGRATAAVGASITAAQSTVGSLFKEPPVGSIAYQPDDPPLSDVLRSRQSSTPYDLFPVESGPLPVSTDIAQQIAQRPKTWDEMSFWEKAKAYVGVVPGAVADTIGVGREGSATVKTGAETIASTAESVLQKAGGVVAAPVKGALGTPNLGGLLSTTLTKVVIGIVALVVFLFFINRFLMKRGL